MTRPRRVVIAAAVAAVAATTCVGAYAAYRATVTNTGNSFAAGTVILSQYVLYEMPPTTATPSGWKLSCIEL